MEDDSPAHGTHAYFQRAPGKKLDVAFHVDLGELVRGHHVVARGLEFSDTGTLLHYDFVPGIQPGPLRANVGLQSWTLHAEDDVGTPYSDPNGGAFAGIGGPAPTHGERDLGARTPSNATQLRLHPAPAPGWRPPLGWTRAVSIDLTSGQASTEPSSERPATLR